MQRQPEPRLRCRYATPACCPQANSTHRGGTSGRLRRRPRAAPGAPTPRPGPSNLILELDLRTGRGPAVAVGAETHAVATSIDVMRAPEGPQSVLTECADAGVRSTR